MKCGAKEQKALDLGRCEACGLVVGHDSEGFANLCQANRMPDIKDSNGYRSPWVCDSCLPPNDNLIVVVTDAVNALDIEYVKRALVDIMMSISDQEEVTAAEITQILKLHGITIPTS